MNNWADEVARDWLGASLEPLETGEPVDRTQLAEQLRAAGDDISDAMVENVAVRIEELAKQTITE